MPRSWCRLVVVLSEPVARAAAREDGAGVAICQKAQAFQRDVGVGAFYHRRALGEQGCQPAGGDGFQGAPYSPRMRATSPSISPT